MDNKQLLENMGRLGYPLLETEAALDPYQTLAQVAASDARRYWEGFPVLLAGAAREAAPLDLRKAEARLKRPADRKWFRALVVLSLAVYQWHQWNAPWLRGLVDGTSDAEKQQCRQYVQALRQGRTLDVGGEQLDPQRLGRAFQAYLARETAEVRSLGDSHSALSLEFALSRVFSPKQKELFRKKLKGVPLTKTEREYFSRVVRKKAAALANAELHQMAQRVLGLS